MAGFGAVPGIIGTLQAMETIKLLLAQTGKTTSTDSESRGCQGAAAAAPGDVGPSFNRRLLVFDGESGLFRTVNLRPKQADCVVCSGPQSRTINRLDDVDYALFCGRGANDKVCSLSPENYFSFLSLSVPYFRDGSARSVLSVVRLHFFDVFWLDGKVIFFFFDVIDHPEILFRR